MSRYTFVLNGKVDRDRVAKYLAAAPVGTRVTFMASRRTTPQNDRMWAMLTDIAEQLPWHGVRLRADDWKILFLDALKREVRAMPALDGMGFVNLGRSSSDLSKSEMSDLIELIFEFGARHGVAFKDETKSIESKI